jgi:hypothetical protein
MMKLHPTQLFAVLFRKGNPTVLSAAVESARQEMEGQGEGNMWRYWYARALLLSGDWQQALAAASEIDEPLLSGALNADALRLQAATTGNSRPFLSFLDERYRTTGSAVDLFAACEAHLQFKDTAYVASNAEELVRRVPTPAALQVGLEGLRQAGELGTIIRLLEHAAPLFPTCQLPIELRRLALYCDQQLGRITRALPKAELLAKETKSAGDIAHVIHLQRSLGDAKKAAVTARDLLDAPDAAAEHLVFSAQAISREDRRLAAKLLARVSSSDSIPPHVVPAAFELAVRLDAHDVARRLSPEIARLAAEDSSPVRALDLHEIRQLLADRAHNIEEAWGSYQRSETPLHAIADTFGRSMVSLFQSAFHPLVRETAHSWAPRPAIFIRHGGRPSDEEPENVVCLYMDVSAVLIAGEIGLLGKLEQTFAPLIIPSAVTQVLNHYLDRAELLPPSVRVSFKSVITLVDANELQIFRAPNDTQSAESSSADGALDGWLAMLKAARESGGYLVDYTEAPGGGATLPELTPEDRDRVIDCRSVLTSLQNGGSLTSDVATLAEGQLPGSGDRSVPMGACLFLHGNVVETLARAGIVEATCRGFRVHAEPEDISRIRAELQTAERSDEAAIRVSRLVDHIREGLASQQWEYVQMPDSASAEEKSRLGVATESIYELLQARPGDHGAVWIDDRFVNAHHQIGGARIITVTGVLRELRRRGALTKGEYFDKLHELRSAEFRYLPLESEEVLHYLLEAPISEGRLVETPRLATLRRYCAVCLLDEGCLQAGGVPETSNRPAGEVAFVMGLHKASTEALFHIWSSPDVPVDTRVARADWLLESLYFDPSLAATLFAPTKTRTASDNAAGTFLAYLYAQGIPLSLAPRELGESLTPLVTQFNTWLLHSTPDDAQSVRAAGKWLKMFLDPQRFVRGRNAEHRRMIRMFLRRSYLALPEAIRRFVSLSEQDRARLGIQNARFLNIGPHVFHAREYFAAVHAALAGQSAVIKAHDTGTEFNLTCTHNGDITLLRHTSPSGDVFVTVDPLLAMLARPRAQRTKLLMTAPLWFEAERREPEHVAQKVASIKDVTRRMLKAVEMRRRSAAFNYEQLASTIRGAEGPTLGDFEPPPLRSLMFHLGLKWPAPPQLRHADYDLAATILLRRVGLTETTRRFAGLPVPLPTSVRSAFMRQSEQRRTRCLHVLREEFTSPIAQINLLSLLWAYEPDESVAQSIYEHVGGEDGIKQFDAFDALLSWSCQRLEHQLGSESAPPSAILTGAWAHATWLHHLLSRRSSPEAITGFFEHHFGFAPRDAFTARRYLSGDVAHPRSIRRTRLVLLGLAASLPSEWTENDVPPKLRAVANAFAFESRDDAKTPNLEMLRLTDGKSNHLSSFLRGTDNNRLDTLLGSAEAAPFTSAEIISGIEQALVRLSEDSAAADQWLVLAALLGPIEPPEPTRSKLTDALRATRFRSFAQTEANVRRVILFFHMQHSGDLSVRSHLRSELLDLTRLYAETDSHEDEFYRADLILECAHHWALASRIEASVSADFNDIMVDVTKIWPAAARSFWKTIRGFIFRVPVVQMSRLWRLILHLRALAVAADFATPHEKHSLPRR